MAEGVKTIAVFLEKKPYYGATVAHIPFLHLLRRVHPGARVVVLSPANSMELLAKVGAADEFVPYEWSFNGIRRTLRAIGADLVFVLRPASRGLDLAVASSRPRASASYHSWLGRLLYSRVVPQNSGIYRARKYLTLLLAQAAARTAPLDGWFREAAKASSFTAPAGRTLAVLPGGGSGDFKLWGIERYLELCGKLAAREPGLNFLWILGPQEAAYRELIEASGVAGRSKILLSAPLQDLAAAALACAAAVGNDCGPGHVFQMCGCPFTCVLSDLDGRGLRCADEWLDLPNRPFATLSDPGKPITDVKVETVLASVLKRLPA
jgi:ADP-heptose:LPS heptosyltransferase